MAKYENKQTGGSAGLLRWLRQINLSDLLSGEVHSRDFNGSRAEYINMRVRLLAMVFSVLAILWIPVDLLIVPGENLVPISVLRLAYSALFLLLGLWASGIQVLGKAHLRLVALVLINCIFYVATLVVFGKESGMEGALVGYSFLPFLAVVLLAIFPLTLYEGLGFTIIIVTTYVAGQIYLGSLLTVNAMAGLWLLALLAGIAIWAQLSQLHMLLRLYREASRDPLTGLVNRRVLNKWLNMEMSKPVQTTLSVLLFDLDFFKRVNDTHGHLTGDKVLQTFSRLLKRDLPGTSLIGRYGGEEFIVVLTGKDGAAAMKTAERIRQDCHEVEMWGPGGEKVRFTVSVGITELAEDDTIETLVRRVDRALYEAKMGGRDRVVLAGE